GDTLNVGRVMTPTLALIVQREDAIRSFQSKPFYVPELTCGGFTAAGEKLEDKAAAEAIRADCDGKPAVVRKVERQKKTVQPPRLYDLTTLQRECNRLYGFTAQQTLDYLQSLYEKKLATYPRTDSQYITADMQATVGSLALRSEEHTSELQSRFDLVCRLLLEKKNDSAARERTHHTRSTDEI